MPRLPPTQLSEKTHMRRAATWLVAIPVLLLGGTPRPALEQAATIPLSLGVTVSSAENVVGGTATVVIQLKNYQGGQVAAPEPIAVSLHSDLTSDATLNISTGQSSAQTEVRFQRP